MKNHNSLLAKGERLGPDTIRSSWKRLTDWLWLLVCWVVSTPSWLGSWNGTFLLLLPPLDWEVGAPRPHTNPPPPPFPPSTMWRVFIEPTRSNSAAVGCGRRRRTGQKREKKRGNEEGGGNQRPRQCVHMCAPLLVSQPSRCDATFHEEKKSLLVAKRKCVCPRLSLSFCYRL